MSTTPTTIRIDGTEYIRADATPAGDPSPVQIVIIEGRWNVVGRVEHHDDGSVTITNAHVIRYWGTTKGIGELPTSKTILDRAGTIRVPARAVIFCVDVAAEAWSL